MGFATVTANNETFMECHAALAVHVAKLPVLRMRYHEAQKMQVEGLIGNCLKEARDYNECIQFIQKLAKEL